MARLLIIDDEKSVCQVLKIAFCTKGHLVETASSGQAGKKKMESGVYDLIISDIRMPDLSGIELLEYARETRNPAPFILITAVPTVSTSITALNLGAYRYLVKTDALVEELSLTVEQVLEELALREEHILAHIPASITGIAATGQEKMQIPAEGFDFEGHIALMEKQYLQAALRAAGGARSQAAHLLRMSYKSFRHYAEKYEI